MAKVIYDSKAQAKVACEAYLRELFALQDRFGLREVVEDECVSTWLYVNYRNEAGDIEEYCY